MNIGIIGTGNVGSALGKGWAAAGHAVKFGARDIADPKLASLLSEIGANATVGSVAEASAFGEAVVLAVPWSAAQDVVKEAGNLTGKILIDCLNPIKPDFSGLAVGLDTSAGEQVANWASGARVVKAFNIIGANIMADTKFGGEKPTLFFCGDDAEAKSAVAGLAADLGFDPVDAGPLDQARVLEPLAWLWISMALKYGQGREIAFRLLKR